MFSITYSSGPIVYTFDIPDFNLPDFNLDDFGDEFDAFQDNINVRKNLFS